MRPIRLVVISLALLFGLTATWHLWLSKDSVAEEFKNRQAMTVLFAVMSVVMAISQSTLKQAASEGERRAGTAGSPPEAGSPGEGNAGVYPATACPVTRRLSEAIESELRMSRWFVLLGTTLAAIGGVLAVWLHPTNEELGEHSWLIDVSRMMPPLLLEAVAFYFLRQHRISLSNVKYYHNEITNMDSRRMAVEVLSMAAAEGVPATAAELVKIRASIIDRLMATERNRILERGQSTEGQHELRSDRALLERLLDRSRLGPRQDSVG